MAAYFSQFDVGLPKVEIVTTEVSAAEPPSYHGSLDRFRSREMWICGVRARCVRSVQSYLSK